MITLVAQKSAILEMSIADRIINAINSTVLYLEKFVLPFALNPHYPYFKVNDVASALKALLVLSIFSGITVVALVAWRKQQRAWLIA